MVFALDWRHFFALEASWDSSKKLKSPPKRMQERLADLERMGCETGPKICNFLDKFWSHFGVQFEPEILPKYDLKLNPKMIPKILDLGSRARHRPYSLRSLLTGHLKPSFQGSWLSGQGAAIWSRYKEQLVRGN